MSDHPRHDRPSAASRPEQTPIVVGFDGSRLAVAATEFAAAEARQCNAPLTLVHGFLWPWFDPPLLPEPGVDVHDPNARVAAVRRLAEATDRVQKQYPDLSVTGRVVDGQAAAVLVDWSRRATLVVVGHRGAGGFAELLAGSVALHTAAHAHCPVVVVRGAPPEPGAPVIVGVDGSPHGRHAVEFAFAVAARRNVPLVAVTVWPPDRPRTHLGRHGRPVGTDAVAYLDDCPVRYPQVQVSTETIRATSVGGALVDRASGAGLVVVGSRGHSTLRGLLLGSVVRALIEHSPCPVAVVRPVAEIH